MRAYALFLILTFAAWTSTATAQQVSYVQPGGPAAYQPTPVGDNYFAGNQESGCATGCYESCCPNYRYLSVFGGWVDWDNIDSDLTLNAPGAQINAASLDVETDDGWAAGGALGRYMNENFRCEIEFAYRNNSFGDATVSVGGQPLIVTDLDGTLNSYSGMYNVYYEFGTFGPRCIRPYIGAGAGFAFLDVDLQPANVPVNVQLDFSTFAYQGIAGASYQISERIDLFGEYRVFGLDDAQVTVAVPNANATADFDGLTHNVFFGARLIVR